MVIHDAARLQGPTTLTNRAWSRASRDPRPIREDVVSRAKAMIARGELDTPERWDATQDRLALAMGR